MVFFWSQTSKLPLGKKGVFMALINVTVFCTEHPTNFSPQTVRLCPDESGALSGWLCFDAQVTARSRQLPGVSPDQSGQPGRVQPELPPRQAGYCKGQTFARSQPRPVRAARTVRSELSWLVSFAFCLCFLSTYIVRNIATEIWGIPWRVLSWYMVYLTNFIYILVYCIITYWLIKHGLLP
jgi:hypothetical protein